MYGGVIQHALALRHPQKAGALLEGLGPQLGYLLDLGPGGKGAVFLPVGHHIFRRGAIKPGHPLKQRGGGGVYVHAYSVNTVLHYAAQGLVQLLGGHIMLILTHTDGLGVDFYQLGQGVLQPPGNGHRRAQIYIELGELLGSQLAGGIHGGPGLGDDHVADMGPGLIDLMDELHGHLLRFPAGCSVADGNVFHPVLGDEFRQGGDGLLLLPGPIGGVDHGGVQHLTGFVHHGHLAAHAVARVQTHGDLALYRRLHQQRLQVQGELADGSLGGLLRQPRALFPL